MGKPKEDPPPDQGWMVTFSDCMTLLLCFFVLLLSFSSFDEMKFETLAGAFQSMSYDWLEENPKLQKDSIIKPEIESNEQPVLNGAHRPSEAEENFQQPREPIEMIDLNMYKDRTVFYLPSKPFFWASGTRLTEEGQKYLRSLSKFLKRMPCRVIIAERSPSRSGDLGLRRSMEVMTFFTDILELSPDRFSLSDDVLPMADHYGRQGILEITLMNIRVEE